MAVIDLARSFGGLTADLRKAGSSYDMGDDWIADRNRRGGKLGSWQDWKAWNAANPGKPKDSRGRWTDSPMDATAQRFGLSKVGHPIASLITDEEWAESRRRIELQAIEEREARLARGPKGAFASLYSHPVGAHGYNEEPSRFGRGRLHVSEKSAIIDLAKMFGGITADLTKRERGTWTAADEAKIDRDSRGRFAEKRDQMIGILGAIDSEQRRDATRQMDDFLSNLVREHKAERTKLGSSIMSMLGSQSSGPDLTPAISNPAKPNPAKPLRAGKQLKDVTPADDVAAALKGHTSREEATAYLEGLKLDKPGLVVLAADLNVAHRKGETKAKIVDLIVAQKVGARLSSDAIFARKQPGPELDLEPGGVRPNRQADADKINNLTARINATTDPAEKKRLQAERVALGAIAMGKTPPNPAKPLGAGSSNGETDDLVARLSQETSVPRATAMLESLSAAELKAVAATLTIPGHKSMTKPKLKEAIVWQTVGSRGAFRRALGEFDENPDPAKPLRSGPAEVSSIVAEGKVLAAYREAMDGPKSSPMTRDYVDIHRVREKLPELTDEQFTATLKALDRRREIYLEADPDRSRLTSEQRAAAVKVAGEEKHFIRSFTRVEDAKSTWTDPPSRHDPAAVERAAEAQRLFDVEERARQERVDVDRARGEELAEKVQRENAIRGHKWKDSEVTRAIAQAYVNVQSREHTSSMPDSFMHPPGEGAVAVKELREEMAKLGYTFSRKEVDAGLVSLISGQSAGHAFGVIFPTHWARDSSRVAVFRREGFTAGNQNQAFIELHHARDLPEPTAGGGERGALATPQAATPQAKLGKPGDVRWDAWLSSAGSEEEARQRLAGAGTGKKELVAVGFAIGLRSGKHLNVDVLREAIIARTWGKNPGGGKREQVDVVPVVRPEPVKTAPAPRLSAAEKRANEAAEKAELIAQITELRDVIGVDRFNTLGRALAGEVAVPEMRQVVAKARADLAAAKRRQAAQAASAVRRNQDVQDWADEEDAYADQVAVSRASTAQVDKIMDLLVQRARSGEGGGFMVGPTDRAGVARMSRGEAESYIDSLSGNY